MTARSASQGPNPLLAFNGPLRTVERSVRLRSLSSDAKVELRGRKIGETELTATGATSREADFRRPIRRGTLAKSQFPAALTDKTGTFHQPASW